LERRRFLRGNRRELLVRDTDQLGPVHADLKIETRSAAVGKSGREKLLPVCVGSP
jgi:hypothetical protein